MKHFISGSISKKLVTLVMLAVLPALVVILYGGMEQRQRSIEKAQRDLQLITRTMAEVQHDITRSTRQILSMLALLPEIKNRDLRACKTIFAAVLEQNADIQNITLTDLNGLVIASGLPSKAVNLGDRKHVREALAKKAFSAGEYIVSRVGLAVPAFAYANPVIDRNNEAVAVLTTAIKLEHFLRFFDVITLSTGSFIAATDHKGIRLFCFPTDEKSNPVGCPIAPRSWKIASASGSPGIFRGKGSDGVGRIFAFEPLRLAPNEPPYIYVWAGMPEKFIVRTANANLLRNLAVMAMATVMSLFIAWSIGERNLISPIKRLVNLTRKFAAGDLEARDELVSRQDEIGKLALAFHDMADTLVLNQKALQQNEARFRLVLDSLDAIVYVADMSTYEVLFINQHGRKAFGDITGKRCWQTLQKGQSGPCPFCTNKYLLDENGHPGPIYTWEFQNTHTGKWLYINDRAIRWLDDRIVRLEVATDITEKLRTEKELIKAKKLESIGVLAGGIAHDFNNILVGILGNIDLALNDADLAEAVRNRLEEAVKASHQARGLTRQLLTFAKGGEPVKETASLDDVIKDSASFVLHGDNTACRFSFPDDLWLVDIDRGQISQVVQNIILNASNAMPEGGTVTVACENVNLRPDAGFKMLRKGCYVKIIIQDQGVGIPPDLIEKIFDPYFSTKREGNGLGLAIAHSIVNKHEGHITVSSTPGHGATFTIYLPASARQARQTSVTPGAPVSSDKNRVLIMDDEQMVRDILKAMLERLGHEVLLAEDGSEAVAAYQEAMGQHAPIGLTIMDLTIPGGMGGREAVRKILALDPDAKVIVSSGYSNDPIMANFRDYGFSAAIAKPFQMAELTAVINQFF